MRGLISKVAAPDVVKNFKEQGVDLAKVKAKAEKDGTSYIMAVVDEAMKVTNGNIFKASELFGDDESRAALMALVKNRDQFEKMRQEILTGSAGALDQRWNFLRQTPAEKQDQADAMAASKLDTAGGWLQPVMTAWKRTVVDLLDPKTLVRGGNWTPAPPQPDEATLQREATERRAAGVRAARDLPGYSADSEKLDPAALRRKGADAGTALEDGLRATAPAAARTMDDIMRQLEERGNVTISPRIQPVLDGGVMIESPSPRPAAPAPAPNPLRNERGSLGNNRNVTQNITFNVTNPNPTSAAREIERSLTKLASNNSSLFDPVG